MRRQVLVFTVLLVALAGVCSADPAPSSAPEMESLHFKLEYIQAKHAVTVLRSIVGLKNIEAVNEREIKITESAEYASTVRAVVEMIDVAPGQEPTMETLQVESDQTVIARSMLPPSMVRETMMELRKQIGAKHVAAVENPPLVILRDSPERVQAAKQLIHSMQEANH